jgi:hypothetical protein
MSPQVSKATPTNFELVLPRLPSSTTTDLSEDVRLNLINTVIPNLTLPSMECRWMGIEARRDAGHHIDYEKWTINFEVDAEFRNWRALYKWLKYISSSSMDPALDHILPSQHQITANLNITDNFKNPVLVINFYSTWIESLNQVVLGYEKGASRLVGGAILQYAAYDITEA